MDEILFGRVIRGDVCLESLNFAGSGEGSDSPSPQNYSCMLSDACASILSPGVFKFNVPVHTNRLSQLWARGVRRKITPGSFGVAEALVSGSTGYGLKDVAGAGSTEAHVLRGMCTV